MFSFFVLIQDWTDKCKFYVIGLKTVQPAPNFNLSHLLCKEFYEGTKRFHRTDNKNILIVTKKNTAIKNRYSMR